MLFNKPHWRIGSDIPGFPIRPICGVLIGFFSTLMGIGGGVMNNTFMTLYGRPIHQAVATLVRHGDPDCHSRHHRLDVGGVGCSGAAAVFPPVMSICSASH